MDGALGQMAMVALGLAGGAVLAWGLVTFLGAASRRARRDISRAVGPDRPSWDPGIWHCAGCLSTNAPSATRCTGCHRPREALVQPAVEPRPDWLPESIAVPPGALVALVHDPAAHADPSVAHWRVTVGGAMVGSAARRDGALALLRALDGAAVVELDVRGTGPAAYRLVDVIARFDAPRFPLDVPCPERGG